MRPHGREGVAAIGSGEQAEGEQERQRPERRHHDIDIARARIVAFPMAGHHQRPGRERHELPRQQEGERVVRQQDQIHTGEKGREERQDPLRFALVRSVPDAVEARGGGAEIDDGEEEGRQGIGPEAGADPGQAQRQHGRDRSCVPDQVQDGATQQGERQDQRAGIESFGADGPPRQQDSGGAEGQQGRIADQEQRNRDRHQWSPGRSTGAPSGAAAACFSRTPRPPPALAAPSARSSTPAASSAAINFISESTLPLITPSLASMRWMVGKESPARSASRRWSIETSARAALSWAALIMSQPSYLTCQTLKPIWGTCNPTRACPALGFRRAASLC